MTKSRAKRIRLGSALETLKFIRKNYGGKTLVKINETMTANRAIYIVENKIKELK